jgi:2-C-methyl-D-erythritol 4-phosphate cytidylyltransferase
MKKYAVLVAAGQGTRMKGILPKQFLTLSGKPVLMHTLTVFEEAGIECIVVMHRDYVHHWENLCKELHFTFPHQVVVGGDTRAQSVKNGLAAIPDDSLVAVHDAVRPLITNNLIDLLYQAAGKYGAAIPVIPVKDTLRMVTENESSTVPRENFRAVQTPQVFRTGELKEAFNTSGFEQFTDEASLYESTGKKVYLLPGEESNIKLTVPSDLLFAEAFLSEKAGHLSD